MITFRVLTEVTDDRRVELTLPPETPIGKAELVVSISSHSQNAKMPRTPLADWAEQSDEVWGDRLDSADVAGFTGRSF